MKRPLAAAVSAAALALASAAPAHAGTYDVKACYGPFGNASWGAEVSSPYATAYANCPGEGIVARMSGAPTGNAPYATGARNVFTAPPGTRAIRFQANVNQIAERGWAAGLVDSTPRWLWCNSCTTWTPYSHFDVWMNSPQLFAQVTCGNPAGCPRQRLEGLMAMRDVIVTVEDNIPPGVAITGGSVTAGGWRSGSQDVQYSAWDSSGIRFVEFIVDGQVRSAYGGRCNEVTSRPCEDAGGTSVLGSDAFGLDGRHTVSIRVLDAAGNRSETRHDVLVDRTSPGQALGALLEGSDAWRARNEFIVRWRNPPQSAAPIVAARYVLCPASTPPGDSRGCVQGERRGRDIAALSDLKVPGAGEWRVALWLVDEAGNADPNRSVSVSGLRFDDTAPALAFTALQPSNPMSVRVRATDTPAGLQSGEIEARRRGETVWRALPTTLDKTGFSAVLDDEAHPKGEYELRARAVDRAGNERTTTTEDGGEPAFRHLPLRVSTRLVVGKRVRLRARDSRGRRRAVLVVHPKASYGRTIPLSGRLTTPGGNPLAAADVEVWEQIKLPAAEWRRIGQIRTSARGRFRFRALRGPSRVLRFRYPGTTTIRARTTLVDLRVRAVTSFKVNRHRVVNGEEVVFRGRLKGGQPGPVGKLLYIQVYTRGRWSTFATPRANAENGRWTEPYRFTATRGRVRYRFRALIPREAGYPYEAGVSRAASVTVQGL